MSETETDPIDETEGRIVELVRALCDAERELYELTRGEIDTVALQEGKTFLLFDAQEKLRSSEEEQRRAAETQTAILDALPAHIALIDHRGVILEVNQCWRHFGVANGLQGADFHTGRNYVDLCANTTGECAEDARAAAEGIRGVIAGRLKEYSLEYRCDSPSQKRWFRLTVSPLQPGRPSGAVVMHMDITDRRVAADTLFRANRALKMMSGCSEKVVRATDEKGLLHAICSIAVESGGYRMAWVGFARDDPGSTIEPVASAGFEEGYLGKITLSWSQDDPMGQGPAGRAIRTGQPMICEDMEKDPFFSARLELSRERGYRGVICLPLRGGRRTFGLLALYSSDVLAFGTGELELLMELADNLAFGIEHLRTNARVQEQAALLDATSDAIVLRGVDHQILFWNKGAERIFGWSAAEVMGDDARRIYISDPAAFDEATRLVMEQGSWAGEQPMHTKDGREIVVDVRWTLLRDAGGAPKSILAINSDITERKKLEAQLMRVQRMESIGTLAGGIAHDLNNALAPILMGAGVLKDEITTELGRQILASMETSAQHGADLVRQVLSFARGVEGKRIPVNLVHLLNDIRDMIRDTFPKNIEFHLLPGRGLWDVVGDPTQLHQVLTNLCVNARDAMPNGGLLRISVENVVLDEVYAGMNPDSEPGSYVVVKVEDTGSGIPPAIRDRIFEPFFTTKEIGKGTGLGLSTTLGIIKNHGGFINLYSEVGKGTTFKVYLPANADATAVEHVAVEQTELPRGNGELILVVDDERTIRTISQKTLERFGYRVILAANGAEGVAIYAQYRDQIAAVLTDMAMPVMDGPSMIIALKTLNPAVRIIGSSGMASNGGVAKALGAGVKYFVPKPYTAETMLKVIAQALSEGA